MLRKNSNSSSPAKSPDKASEVDYTNHYVFRRPRSKENDTSASKATPWVPASVLKRKMQNHYISPVAPSIISNSLKPASQSKPSMLYEQTPEQLA